MKNNEDSFYDLISRLKKSTLISMGYMENISREMFSRDMMRQDAVCRRLKEISETARKLQQLHRGIIEKYSHIQLRKIIALLHLAVNDYADVDLNLMYRIMKSEIPDLVLALKQIERLQIPLLNTSEAIQKNR